jgi:hypothetical protein
MRFLIKSEDGKTIGPVSARELAALAATGEITPRCMVQREAGSGTWHLASKVKGLAFPAIADASANVHAGSDVARSDQGEPEPVVPVAGGQMWWVFVDGPPRGPMSADQVRREFELAGCPERWHVAELGTQQWVPIHQSSIRLGTSTPQSSSPNQPAPAPATTMAASTPVPAPVHPAGATEAPRASVVGLGGLLGKVMKQARALQVDGAGEAILGRIDKLVAKVSDAAGSHAPGSNQHAVEGGRSEVPAAASTAHSGEDASRAATPHSPPSAGATLGICPGCGRRHSYAKESEIQVKQFLFAGFDHMCVDCACESGAQIPCIVTGESFAPTSDASVRGFGHTLVHPRIAALVREGAVIEADRSVRPYTDSEREAIALVATVKGMFGQYPSKRREIELPLRETAPQHFAGPRHKGHVSNFLRLYSRQEDIAHCASDDGLYARNSLWAVIIRELHNKPYMRGRAWFEIGMAVNPERLTELKGSAVSAEEHVCACLDVLVYDYKLVYVYKRKALPGADATPIDLGTVPGPLGKGWFTGDRPGISSWPTGVDPGDKARTAIWVNPYRPSRL